MRKIPETICSVPWILTHGGTSGKEECNIARGNYTLWEPRSTIHDRQNQPTHPREGCGSPKRTWIQEHFIAYSRLHGDHRNGPHRSRELFDCRWNSAQYVAAEMLRGDHRNGPHSGCELIHTSQARCGVTACLTYNCAQHELHDSGYVRGGSSEWGCQGVVLRSLKAWSCRGVGWESMGNSAWAWPGTWSQFLVSVARCSSSERKLETGVPSAVFLDASLA